MAHSKQSATNPRATWDEWNLNCSPRFPHEKVVQFVFRNFRIPLQVKQTALDFGCGSGVHTKFLAECGFDVAAVDVSQIGVNNTALLLERSKLKASLYVGSIDGFVPPETSFDLLLSIGVFDAAGYYVASDACKNLRHLLNPGGIALLIFASNVDFRVVNNNTLGLHGFTDDEVESIIPKEGFSTRWIDRYITTYENGARHQNDFIITLKKELSSKNERNRRALSRLVKSIWRFATGCTVFGSGNSGTSI